MIVDRYKSSQSNALEKKDGSYSSVLEIVQSSQNIDTLNCIQSNKSLDKVTENKIELTNTTENQNPQMAGNHSSKKQIPDNLKKFLFSKNKSNKN